MGIAGGADRRNLEAIALFALSLSFASFSFINLTTRPVSCFPGDIGLTKCPIQSGVAADAKHTHFLNATTVGGSGYSCAASITAAAYVDTGCVFADISTFGDSPSIGSVEYYYLVDFEVSITVLGTQGVVSIYLPNTGAGDCSAGFGLGAPVSREASIVLPAISTNDVQQFTLEAQLLTGVPGGACFGLEAFRTAGVGAIQINGFEGFGYALVTGFPQG